MIYLPTYVDSGTIGREYVDGISSFVDVILHDEPTQNPSDEIKRLYVD